MENYNVKFKKKLGQNFLKDNSIVKKIVRLAELDDDSLVIEVGPGGAIMTKELAKYARNVLAYEVDNDLKDELQRKLSDFNNIDILFKDFLEADLESDIRNYKYKKIFFISNVPYYITTPIVLKLIKSKIKFEKIIMMVQREVGERFSGTCGKKDYGSITVLLNYFYDVKLEFLVSRKEFIPEPKVDSVVISFTEKQNKLKVDNFLFFEKFVKDSFQFKRKNLRNNLKYYDLDIIEMILKKYGFDLSVRAEALKYEIFVELANALYKK